MILSQYPASVSDIIHLYKGIRSEHIENSRLVSGALIFALTAQTFLLGGCIESSEYGSALEYAEKWCGPCKEVDSYEADDDLVIHKMKDKEYRFTYVVSELRMTSSIYKYSVYNVEDFCFYYLQEFMDEADLEDIIDEYDLTIEVEEPKENTHGQPELVSYSPKIMITTDMLLSEEDNSAIASELIDELEDFDSDREVFTQKDSSSCVFIEIRSQAWDNDTSTGRRWHLVQTTYGLT